MIIQIPLFFGPYQVVISGIMIAIFYDNDLYHYARTNFVIVVIIQDNPGDGARARDSDLL